MIMMLLVVIWDVLCRSANLDAWNWKIWFCWCLKVVTFRCLCCSFVILSYHPTSDTFVHDGRERRDRILAKILGIPGSRKANLKKNQNLKTRGEQTLAHVWWIIDVNISRRSWAKSQILTHRKAMLARTWIKSWTWIRSGEMWIGPRVSQRACKTQFLSAVCRKEEF